MRLRILLTAAVAAVSLSISSRAVHAQTQERAYCGRPVSLAETPIVRDALVVLLTTIDIEDCEPELCDVTADCVVTVTDARDVLAAAAALPYEFDCQTDCSGAPCQDGVAPVCGGQCEVGGACVHVNEAEVESAVALGPAWIPPAGACACVADEEPEPTTTTIATTTSTTIGVTTSTTVTTSSTTSTTLAVGGDVEAGRALYDGACFLCHVLGDHDVTPGIGPDLGSDGGDLLPDMLLVTPLHASIPEPPGPALSDQELNDLKAFIDTFPEVVEPEPPLP